MHFSLNGDYAATIGAMDPLASWKRRRRSPGCSRHLLHKLSKSPEARGLSEFLDLDNAQNDYTDFQARRRCATLQSELGQSRRNRNTKLMCLSPILRVCVAAIASLALTAPLAAQSRLAADLARYEQAFGSGAQVPRFGETR